MVEKKKHTLNLVWHEPAEQRRQQQHQQQRSQHQAASPARSLALLLAGEVLGDLGLLGLGPLGVAVAAPGVVAVAATGATAPRPGRLSFAVSGFLLLLTLALLGLGLRPALSFGPLGRVVALHAVRGGGVSFCLLPFQGFIE